MHCYERRSKRLRRHLNLRSFFRSRKIAGTLEALLGGDEIYHYHSKVKKAWCFVHCRQSQKRYPCAEIKSVCFSWWWRKLTQEAPSCGIRITDIGTTTAACTQKWEQFSCLLTSRFLPCFWLTNVGNFPYDLIIEMGLHSDSFLLTVFFSLSVARRSMVASRWSLVPTNWGALTTTWWVNRLGWILDA